MGGQLIDGAVISRIQELVDQNSDVSRVVLSRRICEQLRWRARNGQLKEVSCRKALKKLQRDGKIRLPEAGVFSGRRKPKLKVEPMGLETVIHISR